MWHIDYSKTHFHRTRLIQNPGEPKRKKGETFRPKNKSSKNKIAEL